MRAPAKSCVCMIFLAGDNLPPILRHRLSIQGGQLKSAGKISRNRGIRPMPVAGKEASARRSGAHGPFPIRPSERFCLVQRQLRHIGGDEVGVQYLYTQHVVEYRVQGIAGGCGDARRVVQFE